MRTYEIRTKEGYFIGVDTMTPEQARKAEKDFIIKEAQPKRSKIGASTAGRSPGADDGRPERKKYMWYIINGAGERCKAVETEKEAIKLVANNDWYVDYIYSNESYMC